MMRSLCLVALVAGCMPETSTPNAARHVAPAVVCTSTGSGASATGGDINLSETVVTRSTPVMGMVTATVTLQNAHPTEPLEIQAFTQTGSNAWSMTASTPCDVLPCTIAPMGMILLTFNFAPMAIGELDGLMTIGSCDPDEGAAVIMLEGTGLGTTLGLSTPVNPPVSFGSGPIGTALTPQTFTVYNMPATQPLGVSIMVTNTTAPPTFTVNMAGATIPTNGTQDIVVTCTPRIAGTVTGTFIVTGMATFGDPVQFQVECTGTSGTLSVVPSTIALGDARIDNGGFRVVETVLLNTNGPPLTIAAGHPVEQPAIPHIALTPAMPQSIVMGPGSSFNVSFDPGTVEGPVSTMINLSAGSEMVSIPFSANVVRAVLDAPANVNFGSLCVGKPLPPPQELRIKSTGTATIHMAQRPELEM
ncbi:MAG: choice-of-anchor D domain-containing protein, partial [Deltaproteobacteria bacterium]|nr:choice-of-anchor D domain-containing protein [Deltaproteobacteria bacterium]